MKNDKSTPEYKSELTTIIDNLVDLNTTLYMYVSCEQYENAAFIRDIITAYLSDCNILLFELFGLEEMDSLVELNKNIFDQVEISWKQTLIS